MVQKPIVVSNIPNPLLFLCSLPTSPPMASSLLRASPLSLLSRLKPLNRRPPASHLRRLLLLSGSASASSRSTPTLRTLAAATDAATPPEEAALPAAEAKLERMQPLQWPQRDALCGELGAGDAGRRVRLCGWVALRRSHAGLTFLTLRDSSGMVQVTRFRFNVVGLVVIVVAKCKHKHQFIIS